MKASERDALLRTLEARFERHPARHAGLSWPHVRERLLGRPEALEALAAMESTGGEPDVISMPNAGDAVTFCDCSPESPAGRRSLCYDAVALEARKANKPAGSAQAMAGEMGASLLTEAQYHHLQSLGPFDLKTSSWIETPPDVRQLGGALFGDRRFGRVFIYHNGAESYYAARGFRAWISV